MTTLLLVVWLAFRVTRAVDLSDESYYAVFVDDWLKEGIRASPFLTLHQTAALVVYPAALLFRWATGSTDGLILFLRSVYIVGTVIAAISAGALFRRLGTRWGAWLAGALGLAFIPFGLPAPSYNTIGEQATIVALAGFGCAVLEGQERARSSILWLVFSAAAWAIATVAYPSLLFALGLLFACLSSIVRPPRALLLAYGGLVVGFQAAAWLSVIGLLTWSRILDSIAYQSSIVGFDAGRKLTLVGDVLIQNVGFSTAVGAAILVGLVRSCLNQSTAAIATGVLFIPLLFIPAALFVHSHDAMLLAALSGLGLLRSLRPGRASSARLLATLYAVSLAAGAATAATATYALFSFPIGGVLAAIIAVLAGSVNRGGQWWAVPGAAFLSVLVWGSASLYYGERPAEAGERRERVTEGAYAGLFASAETAQLLRTSRMALGKWSGADDTITVVGRLSGLYLLTQARPRALMPFQLTTLAQPRGLAATYRYYTDPANRPTVVAVYADAYFTPVNPFGSSFDEWYELADQERTPLGMLSLFRRRD
jgi:hypothetical protein